MARIRLELPENYLFSCQIPVRITDINYGGHLGNDKILTMMHEARVLFLANYGFSEMDCGANTSIIMSDVAIIYKKEVFYGGDLRFKIALMDFSSSGLDMFYLIENVATNIEIARAKTGIVFFDYQNRKVCPIPKLFLDKIGIQV